MEIFRNTEHSRELLQKRFDRASGVDQQFVSLAIGDFDSFHIGHAKVLNVLHDRVNAEMLRRDFDSSALLNVLFSFYPSPKRYFRKHLEHGASAFSLPNLITLRDKICNAGVLGIDVLFMCQFNRAIADMEAEDFVEKYLVGLFGVKLVVVGQDWRFGRGRRGDGQLLSRLGKRLGFEVVVVEDVLLKQERVSSSSVRKLVEQGHMDKAADLLGRCFSMSGIVRHGSNRGAKLGVPTINLLPPATLLPPDGVYATIVDCGGQRYRAVTNIGIRPTFGQSERVVESHLLDVFGLDLYGKRVKVHFVSYLRPERKFESAQLLMEQIARDIEDALAISQAVIPLAAVKTDEEVVCPHSL